MTAVQRHRGQQESDREGTRLDASRLLEWHRDGDVERPLLAEPGNRSWQSGAAHVSLELPQPTLSGLSIAENRVAGMRTQPATRPRSETITHAEVTQDTGWARDGRSSMAARSVPLFRRQRPFDLLAHACHCSSFFALAFCGRFFIGCPGTQLRNQAGALDRATETAQCNFHRLVGFQNYGSQLFSFVGIRKQWRMVMWMCAQRRGTGKGHS